MKFIKNIPWFVWLILAGVILGSIFVHFNNKELRSWEEMPISEFCDEYKISEVRFLPVRCLNYYMSGASGEGER